MHLELVFKTHNQITNKCKSNLNAKHIKNSIHKFMIEIDRKSILINDLTHTVG